MEAWALVDLATALDETSSTLSQQQHSRIIQSNSSSNKIGKVHNRRRTKSTGNLSDRARRSSSGSPGEMDESPNQPPSSLQTENEELVVNPLPFAVPRPQMGPSVAYNIVRMPTQPLSVAESDSVNETVSTMRPHTRRKRRFKRMAVDPEPHQQMHHLEMEDGAGLNCPAIGNNNNTCAQHPAGFSFSTFASSSIFAKPRMKKGKKGRPVTIQKVANITIGKRKRSVRERSIECELEKISLNSSPEDAVGGDLVPTAGRSGSGAAAGDGHLHHSSRHHGRHGSNHLAMMMMDAMDLDMKQHEQVSSSSVSGSESDPGYSYAGYDEDGREADDEQSDWYPETGGSTWGPAVSTSGTIPKPWWERPILPASDLISSLSRPIMNQIDDEGEDPDQSSEEVAPGMEDEADKRFRQLFKGTWQHLSDEAKEAYRLRMQKLRDRIPGREIRAGRRHLGAQRGPAFSILTSANEKLSRFLQDPAQSELRLHPMQKSERDQLSHLASLYSLQMLSEGARGLKCPVLKKTCNTMQAVRIDMDRSPSLWTDFKRQRKTPPASVTSESAIEESLGASIAPGDEASCSNSNSSSGSATSQTLFQQASSSRMNTSAARLGGETSGHRNNQNRPKSLNIFGRGSGSGPSAEALLTDEALLPVVSEASVV